MILRYRKRCGRQSRPDCLFPSILIRWVVIGPAPQIAALKPTKHRWPVERTETGSGVGSGRVAGVEVLGLGEADQIGEGVEADQRVEVITQGAGLDQAAVSLTEGLDRGEQARQG